MTVSTAGLSGTVGITVTGTAAPARTTTWSRSTYRLAPSGPRRS